MLPFSLFFLCVLTLLRRLPLAQLRSASPQPDLPPVSFFLRPPPLFRTKFRIAPVDVDGNTALTAPTCSAGAACATATSAARPLATVTLPSFPPGFLVSGSASNEVAVTLSPAPIVPVAVTLTVFGALYTIIPSVLTFPAGVSSASFRVLSSAAGIPATLVYSVSSTASGGASDYGSLLTARDGTANGTAGRYVVDNASGQIVYQQLLAACSLGFYPASSTAVASGNGMITYIANCNACPTGTTTLKPASKVDDCVCASGVDARVYLQAPAMNVTIDPLVTPCIDQSVYCSAGGGCLAFSGGRLSGVAPGFWKVCGNPCPFLVLCSARDLQTAS